MFGLGFQEILVIALIILLLFGGKKTGAHVHCCGTCSLVSVGMGMFLLFARIGSRHIVRLIPDLP